MSRMHSSKSGSSGSDRPHLEENPEWVSMEREEIEEKVLDLFKEGKTASEIGVVLRDQYGVPNVKLATGKSVTDILEENDLDPDIPEDLMALMEKAVNLKQHQEENLKDKKNKRGLRLVESKIRRLADYYRETGKLDEDWKYTIKKAEMLTQ